MQLSPAESSLQAEFVRRRWVWIAAVTASLIIAGFHFDLLAHAGGFWRDEVNLINVAGHPSLHEMSGDSFPVLMPLLVKCWTGIGLAQSDAGLRLLGIFIGLAIVGGLWIASFAAGRTPPVIGLALFALNSNVIIFGDSLRGYGLGALMIALTFAAACAHLKRPGWPQAGWLAVTTVLSVQALFHNAILVGAICLGAMAVCARRKNWLAAAQIGAAGFLAAASLLPYFVHLAAGDGTLKVLRVGNSWSGLASGLVGALDFSAGPFVCIWVLLAVLTVGLAAAAGLKKIPNDPQAVSKAEIRLFAGTTLLVALAGFMGFLWLAALPEEPWYFIPLMLLLAVCFDASCSTLSNRAGKFVLAGSGLILVLSLPADGRHLNFCFTNVDAWAAEIAGKASPDDYTVVTPWFYGITFAHYYQGPAPWTTVPPLTDHSTHRYDLLREQMLATNTMQPVLEKITATLRSGHRVWFLCPVKVTAILREGVPKPRMLPSPPLPRTGWSPDPYVGMWTSQVVFLLVNNGREVHIVDGNQNEPYITEQMDLLIIDGWRDTP